MRLSVSPATPFSDWSLPNHTKMFELVHMVTSMDDFADSTVPTNAGIEPMTVATGALAAKLGTKTLTR